MPAAAPSSYHMLPYSLTRTVQLQFTVQNVKYRTHHIEQIFKNKQGIDLLVLKPPCDREKGARKMNKCFTSHAHNNI